jgi:aldose 1-epimerase
MPLFDKLVAMDVIKLQFGPAVAEILPKRGALISKLDLQGSSGIFWMPKDFSATAKDWPGGGLPFLFPFAGRVQHKGELYKYGLGNHVFSMPIHGFSWASCWDVLKTQPDRASLQLRATPESRSVYPFDFSIVMEISLTQTTLSVTVHIKNLTTLSQYGAEKMPVALGWHPYFSLSGQTTRLKLAAQSAFPVTAQGMAGDPMDAKKHLGEGPWILPKTELNSLILGHVSENRAELFRQTSQISMHCVPRELFNYFVTWSNQPSEFLCVEPWMSQPDAVAVPTGCRWLASHESLSVGLNITAS